ncbi:MAG: hypothetical protein ACYCRE_05135 [Acidobacteriaceae bacterium]
MFHGEIKDACGDGRKQAAMFSDVTLQQRIPVDRPARQVKLRGLDRVNWFWKLSITAHNLTRMRRLIPIELLVQ